jgi:secondary thiamine-phosphate synthase enzyme
MNILAIGGHGVFLALMSSGNIGSNDESLLDRRAHPGQIIIEIMKSFRKELAFETRKRREFLNITPQVEQALAESGIREGLLLVNAMHITASVFINDDESGLHQDFETWLEGLAPEKPYSRYRHNGYEDNADAHLKRTLMGREVVVAVTGGELDFGPWERIFYGEFDGKRRKRVLIKIVGE